MGKAKAIRMPGKSARGVAISDPEASHDGRLSLGIMENTKPSAASHQASRGGSRSPIPSEPAPCHRPWITPQGATRRSDYNRNTARVLSIRLKLQRTSNHALPKHYRHG